MKIPLTKYGWPQVVFYPGLLLIFMIVLYFGASPTTVNPASSKAVVTCVPKPPSAPVTSAILAVMR